MILACDPGVTGAFAKLDGERLVVRDMPTRLSEVNGHKRNTPDRDAIIGFLFSEYILGVDTLLIEHVWGYEGQGGGAAFNFGFGAGGIEYAAASIGMKVEKVAAITWKSAMKVPADKSKAIDRASQEFPAFVNLWAAVRGNGSESQRSGRAEAALLCRYGELTLGALPC